MSDPEAKSNGWSESLRRSSDSILGLIQSRLELFAVELQEEKLRVINLVVWMSIAISLGSAGLSALMAALAFILWHSAGYLGLIALGAVAMGGAAVILCFIRHRLHHGWTPFSTTVAEFRKDRECLSKKT